MSICSEFAVFKVSKENKSRIIELSLSIFKEMNANGTVITAHEILQKTDNENELCWHLTWISQEAAKETTAQWPSFPSTKEFQSLVGDNVYYGHFIEAVST
ncbi:hypothetical protein [Thalassotalea ganghwensis]